MYKVMNSFDELHVYSRGGIYYFVRLIPADLRQFYSAFIQRKLLNVLDSVRTISKIHAHVY